MNAPLGRPFPLILKKLKELSLCRLRNIHPSFSWKGAVHRTPNCYLELTSVSSGIILIDVFGLWDFVQIISSSLNIESLRVLPTKCNGQENMASHHLPASHPALCKAQP